MFRDPDEPDMGWNIDDPSYEETPPRDETPIQRANRRQRNNENQLYAKQRDREIIAIRDSQHLRSCERLPPPCKNNEYHEASLELPVCLLCLLECHNHQVLARHVKNYHKMQCSLCPVETRSTYATLELLHEHFMTHSLAERAVLETDSFPCGLNGCPKVFYSKYLLERHHKHSAGLSSCRKRFRCTLTKFSKKDNKLVPCIAKFATEIALKRHIIRQHGRPPDKQPKHVCAYHIDKRFMHPSGLEKHMMKSHCQCSACGDWLSNADCLPKHRVDRNHVQCTCGAWFDTPVKIVQHMVMHRENE